MAVLNSLRNCHTELRECKARPLAKEEDSETSDENRPLPGTTTPPSAHAGRSFGASRRKVGRIALGTKSCQDTRSTTQPPNRSWDAPQICEGALPLVEDVEIDGVLVAYSNDCFVEGVQHHHGSQLLAAVMDRWPSFRPLWVQKTSVVPSMSAGDRSHLRALDEQCLHQSGKALQDNSPFSIILVWQRAFDLILLVTYMRPSELLALRKKELVPPLRQFSREVDETGVSAKTRIRDGSVLMEQRWHQWVNKLLPALKAGNPEEHDYVPNARQWSRHRSGVRFQNTARSAKTRSVESVHQCHKIRQKQSSGGPAHSETSWKYSRNAPGYC